jgi:hypothetical protein
MKMVPRPSPVSRGVSAHRTASSGDREKHTTGSPTLDAALALVREFGVSLDWIYTGVWSRPLPQNLRDKIREIEPVEDAAPTFLDLYPGHADRS